MKEFIINGIKVVFNNYESATQEMAEEVIMIAERRKANEAFIISTIIVTKVDSEFEFDVQYKDEDQPKFGRIRRITGYLTGTTDRWNNAKRAELKDRVCHCG